MRRLYLDDLRPCPIGWDCVRSYDEFVAYLQTQGMPDVISFDHDLSWDHYPVAEINPDSTNIPYGTYVEKTGYDCALYLVDNDLGLPSAGWAVHSMNPVGTANITFALRSYARAIRNVQP